MDRRNFAIGCLAAVLVVALTIGVACWAGVAATRSVTERKKAVAAICLTLEHPADRISCALAVNR